MIFRRALQVAEMVKFSHSVFALPFALASMLVASQGLPPVRLVILIILAMVTLRNAGMSFNRFVDAPFDAKNPRTAARHIPRGLLSKRFVLAFSFANAGLFVLIASQINPLCFYLSFAAVGIVYLYSFTKRFTDWSHLVLGLVLGISPVAAWIAVTNRIDLPPILLGLAVIFWVAGFDIIYATQDYEFDRSAGLHSLVVRFGIGKSLILSRIFHLLTLLFLFLFGKSLGFGGVYYLTLSLVSFLFFYEHSLVSPKDLSRVNAAFFNVNSFISLLFLAGVTLSV
jgi:4-hydroxybenzoate polyprenyltransferase